MSDTPRTDAEIVLSIKEPGMPQHQIRWQCQPLVWADFARQLECELSEAIAELDKAVAVLTRIKNDSILDGQDAEYYIRIMKMYVSWFEEALKRNGA